LISAAKTGTPARLKLLGQNLNVTVFPVPVAPTIRPWRLAKASGSKTTSPAAVCPTSIDCILKSQSLFCAKSRMAVPFTSGARGFAMDAGEGQQREQPGAPAKSGSRRWRRLNARSQRYLGLLNQPFFRLLEIAGAVVGFAVLIGTAWQIWLDYAGRAQDRTEQAWTRLLTQAAGNTGKGAALTYLIDSGADVDGVDISCAAVGNYDAAAGKCRKPAILTDVEIRTKDTMVSDLSLADEVINGMKLSGGFLVKTDFTGATISNLRVSNSAIGGSFAGARVYFCNFRGAFVDMKGPLGPGAINFCELSGTKFGIADEDFVAGFDNSSWAWADSPPAMSEDTSDGIKLHPLSDAAYQRLSYCPTCSLAHIHSNPTLVARRGRP
jgi:hypothetical protein